MVIPVHRLVVLLHLARDVGGKNRLEPVSGAATRNKIAEEVGNFVLVSFSTFEAHGVNRTRYTVRKPRGEKLIHLIGFENGTIQAV
jgi:hypothetical protein